MTTPFRIPETPDYVGFAQKNAMLDLSPINDAISGWQKQQQIGVENKRAEDQLGMQRTRLGMEQEKFGEDKAQKVRERAGNLALLTLQDGDPNRRAQRWQQFLQSHPDAKNLDPKYHDPNVGPMAVLADAGMVQQHLDYQMRKAAEGRAQNQDARAAATHNANMAQYQNMTPAERAQVAPTLGLTPGTNEHRTFIATGQYSPGEAMKLNIVPEGATLVATNPRTTKHEVVATGGPKEMKDYQTKDAMWAERLIRSEGTIDKIAGIDPRTGEPTSGAYNPARTANRFAPDDPGIWNLYTANLFNSKNWQQYQQSAREGIAAILRKDTGAAVTKDEWNLYFPMYFPQPGDDPAVVLQKKKAREAAGHALKAASGGAYERMFPPKPGAAPGAPVGAGANDPLGIR